MKSPGRLSLKFEISNSKSQLPFFSTIVAFVWATTVLPMALGADAKSENLRQQAEQSEKTGNWEEASALYADLFARDRGQFALLRDHYQTCLRHVHQIRRHHEDAFREQVLNRDISGALKVYEEVLRKLQANYFEKDKVEASRLFRLGLAELGLDLQDKFFCQVYLPSASTGDLEIFQDQLQAQWAGRNIRDVSEAKKLALEVALDAQKVLGLKPAVTLVEMACGACNALDEYTQFLTPAMLAETYASLEGTSVGIGAELSRAGFDQPLVISQVLRGSPADIAGLKPGDRVIRIDHETADQLSVEQATENLKGDVGSAVELEVLSPGQIKPRSFTLTRRAVFVPSVLNVQMLDEMMGIGYFQLIGFQESTLAEIDEAVQQLMMQGAKVLILDIRGNPGGLFQTAVQVAERFLTAGIIVATESQVSAFSKTYTANNSSAWKIPLILLMDSDTASAAEVIAGAFKDHQRATLVGQTTFGKGCIQYVVELSSAPGGIRITQARFFSPQGHYYGKGGVVPHIPVGRTSLMAFDEAQLQAAVQAAKRLVMMTSMR